MQEAIFAWKEKDCNSEDNDYNMIQFEATEVNES